MRIRLRSIPHNILCEKNVKGNWEREGYYASVRSFEENGPGTPNQRKRAIEEFTRTRGK